MLKENLNKGKVHVKKKNSNLQMGPPGQGRVWLPALADTAKGACWVPPEQVCVEF